RPQNALPFGVLHLKGVQRRQERVGLGLAAGGPRPGSDVVVARGLPTVLDLGYLRWRPRQGLRDLPAATASLLAKLAEPFAERVARLVDVSRAGRAVRWQSRPV